MINLTVKINNFYCSVLLILLVKTRGVSKKNFQHYPILKKILFFDRHQKKNSTFHTFSLKLLKKDPPKEIFFPH
jgi:hypothetical protein